MIVFVEKTVGKIFVAASKKEIIARSSRRISPGTAAAFFFSVLRFPDPFSTALRISLRILISLF